MLNSEEGRGAWDGRHGERLWGPGREGPWFLAAGGGCGRDRGGLLPSLSPEAYGQTESVPWDSPYRRVWKGWPLPSPTGPPSGPRTLGRLCADLQVPSLLSLASSCPEALSPRGDPHLTAEGRVGAEQEHPGKYLRFSTLSSSYLHMAQFCPQIREQMSPSQTVREELQLHGAGKELQQAVGLAATP